MFDFESILSSRRESGSYAPAGLKGPEHVLMALHMTHSLALLRVHFTFSRLHNLVKMINDQSE